MQRKVVPMIHVPDVQRTVDWYREIGFDVANTYGDSEGGLSFAILSFGAGQVMFSSGGKQSSARRREVDLYVYTDDVDALHERLKNRVEIVEGPGNAFYGMREIIVRDLNGFWITFGQEVPAELLTPWPAVDPAQLRIYEGKYRSEDGLSVLITSHEGRLLAFPEDSGGVFLQPRDGHSFATATGRAATVAFEGGSEHMTSLIFEQDGRVIRFERIP